MVGPNPSRQRSPDVVASAEEGAEAEGSVAATVVEALEVDVVVGSVEGEVGLAAATDSAAQGMTLAEEAGAVALVEATGALCRVLARLQSVVLTRLRYPGGVAAALGTKEADLADHPITVTTVMVAALLEDMDQVDSEEAGQGDSAPLAVALVGLDHLAVDSVAEEDIAGTSSAKALVGMMTGTSSVRATRLLPLVPLVSLEAQTFALFLAVLVGPVVCSCSARLFLACSFLLVFSSPL